MRNRACCWPKCLVKVPASRWGCRLHWFMLPLSIREAIWRAYRPGQEDDLDLSEDYVKAFDAAQDWIQKYLNQQPATPTPSEGSEFRPSSS